MGFLWTHGSHHRQRGPSLTEFASAVITLLVWPNPPHGLHHQPGPQGDRPGGDYRSAAGFDHLAPWRYPGYGRARGHAMIALKILESFPRTLENWVGYLQRPVQPSSGEESHSSLSAEHQQFRFYFHR